MEEKIVNLLKEKIGFIIRIGGALGNKEEKLNDIHIENNNIYINNNSINLSNYRNNKILSDDLISFRDDINEELIVILLIKNN